MEPKGKNQFKKSMLSVLTASIFLTACSTGELVGPDKKFDKAAGQEHLTAHEAQAVFFLEDDESSEKKVILVSKDERLIGALKKETYIPATICTGAHTFAFQRSDGNIHLIKTDTNSQNVKVNVSAGEALYMRVNVAKDGVLSAERITENDALDTLDDADYQSFLVNRRIDDCTSEVIPPTPVILEEIELSADALFEFNGATLVDLVAKDKLNALLEKIKTSDLDITNIVVVGHADRIGVKAYNQTLSEQRANTVASFLKANGIKEDIKAIGFGSAEPITKGQCSSQLSRKLLIECLQPDRRVSVELWGDVEVVEMTDSVTQSITDDAKATSESNSAQ